MQHVQRHRETGRKFWVEALLERIEHRVGRDVRLGARWSLVYVVVVFLVVLVLAGVVVVVVAGVQVQYVERAADAVFPQLFQL